MNGCRLINPECKVDTVLGTCIVQSSQERLYGIPWNSLGSTIWGKTSLCKKPKVKFSTGSWMHWNLAVCTHTKKHCIHQRHHCIPLRRRLSLMPSMVLQTSVASFMHATLLDNRWQSSRNLQHTRSRRTQFMLELNPRHAFIVHIALKSITCLIINTLQTICTCSKLA